MEVSKDNEVFNNSVIQVVNCQLNPSTQLLNSKVGRYPRVEIYDNEQ